MLNEDIYCIVKKDLIDRLDYFSDLIRTKDKVQMNIAINMINTSLNTLLNIYEEKEDLVEFIGEVSVCSKDLLEFGGNYIGKDSKFIEEFYKGSVFILSKILDLKREYKKYTKTEKIFIPSCSKYSKSDLNTEELFKGY